MSSRPARGAARLAAILDALPDALLLVNGNGTVVNANAIAVETLEAPGAPLIGRGLLDIVPDFDPRRIPGSMRHPDEDPTVRTPPKRMVARRTDGTELPVEVTSAGLDAGHSPYASAIEAAFADDHGGQELLMLVVRDLSGTLDTEAELVRQQRQTEMILRAASEGVVGVDTAGRVVLVNPAAAQMLGHRASGLGGQELHPLVQHSRGDGTPLAFEETPLYDTLTSGRKHRVRGQVLWTKDGRPVPVDMTTAPVRDGEQLVGAVLAFTDRRPHDTLAARHAQLMSVLDASLRGPLSQLRDELNALATDPAGQLWPEANQVLHHLSAGYSRITTLVDNVLAYQRLDEGAEKLTVRKVSLDSVVTSGVEGATELIGPGRAQFAVHAPPITAEVDPERMALALAHLVADVAGVDATGRASSGAPAPGDSTIVVAAAQRGEVVRIEVRGPYRGGDPVHEPVVRGIVRQHGGVLQTHEMPGAAGGHGYVLEVPVAAGAAAPVQAPARDSGSDTTVMPVPTQPARGTGGPGVQGSPAPGSPGGQSSPVQQHGESGPAGQGGPGRPGGPQGGPPAVEPVPDTPSGRRRRVPAGEGDSTGDGQRRALAQVGHRESAPGEQAGQPGAGTAEESQQAPQELPQPTGRRRRAKPPEESGAAPAPAVPAPAAPAPAAPAEAAPAAAAPEQAAVPQAALPGQPGEGQTQQPEPEDRQEQQEPQEPQEQSSVEHSVVAGSPILDGSAPRAPAPRQSRALPMPGSERAKENPRSSGVSVQTLGQGVPGAPVPAVRRPAPAAASAAQHTSPGRRRKLATPPAEDSRTGAQQGQEAQSGPQMTQVPAQASAPAQAPALPQPPAPAPPQTHAPAQAPAPAPAQDDGGGAQGGRQFTISAPAAGAAEGPEPLDGPNGAVEVTEESGGSAPASPPAPADDELPPEPLDNPRRLLVWPEPDVSTQQALSDRGYRPVIVNSREEVDAQIAAYPAALFVDPLTGPITRTALQSLRTAAVAAEVPVLVTAGLGQASRDAAYGADPAVLLKALAPRDSEQHPPRVLLVEEQQAIADALARSLERRGMQAAHADSDAQAMEVATQLRPNLVVMDLNQVRRRRAGIIDWLRVNGLLSRTPFVVYTAAEMDPAQLPQLASGETVLFLAERSTNPEVQARIVDLLAKIGAA